MKTCFSAVDGRSQRVQHGRGHHWIQLEGSRLMTAGEGLEGGGGLAASTAANNRIIMQQMQREVEGFHLKPSFTCFYTQGRMNTWLGPWATSFKGLPPKNIDLNDMNRQDIIKNMKKLYYYWPFTTLQTTQRHKCLVTDAALTQHERFTMHKHLVSSLTLTTSTRGRRYSRYKSDRNVQTLISVPPL